MIGKGLLKFFIRHPFRFLIIFLYRIKILKKPRVVKVKTYFGKSIYLMLPEIVSSIIYLTEKFETDVEKMIEANLSGGMVFADIGAHIGYFSLLGSKLVGGKGRVYSFEPTHSTFRLLKKNCSSCRNIFLVNKAVFSKEKIMEFNDYGVEHSAFNSFFSPRTPSSLQGKKIKVKTTKLDSFFKKIKKPDFIKIDAETSEYEVLVGMKNILRAKPVVCMEIGSKKAVEFLLSKGYSPFIFEKGKIVSYKNYSSKNYNLLFLPKKIN